MSPLGCSALVMNGGQALHVRAATPADLATLPHAASLCAQYLHLKDGDGAILNDPLSSGTTLNDITLVLGIDLEGTECDVLLARRLSFGQRLSEVDRLDDQGVRVPPTPLTTHGELNSDLLNAIAHHPFAPANMVTTIERAWREMKRVANELKQQALDPGSELKRIHFARYLADSSAAFESLMTRLTLGHSVVTQILPTGETLKLQLDVTETYLQFDFAGSDNSENLALTELETFGACVAAIVNIVGQALPMNAGTFGHFRVSAPAKTMVSTRALKGLFNGVTSGVATVAFLVQEALAKLNPTLRRPEEAATDAFFEARFANSSYRGRLSPGSAASSDQDGTTAHAVLTAPITATQDGRLQRSIESIERSAPVEILIAGARTGSGGKGRQAGGDGGLLSFRALEEGTFLWNLGRSASSQAGFDGGKAGTAAEIEILRAGSTEPEKTSGSIGQISLRKGDQVTLFGAGGGGFGSSKQAAK